MANYDKRFQEAMGLKMLGEAKKLPRLSRG